MKLKHLFLLIFSHFLAMPFIAQKTSSIEYISTKKNFNVSDKIILEFKVKKDSTFQLYCSNSYGSTIIESKSLNKILTFKIPEFLSKKRGVLNWKIIDNKSKDISGIIELNPMQQPKTIETYLGPPSIDAGGLDYTMLVVIPTDSLDNPIVDYSKVNVKHQFLESEKRQTIYTDKLLAFTNIFSPLKSGRMIISSESFGLDSKEFDVNIMPAIATDFKIFAKRNHEYADGNQITTFYTSTIKDKFNNIVSDGSFVEFYIKNNKGNILKTSGTTINGVASAKIIHPDFEDSWAIKAYFDGISESNVLTLNYKKVIKDYDVLFNNKNRNIKIGPLKSFMGQIIPDGLVVKLSIYQENKLLEVIFKESKNGFAEFNLDANIFENGTYSFTTETARIKKDFKNLQLW